MNKDEIRTAVNNANTKAEIESVLEIVVEKIQDKKVGKKLKETLKIYEEELMDKLDKLSKEEQAGETKEVMTLEEGKYVKVREHSNDKETINTFKVVAITDKEIVLQDLTEYVGLHIILKAEKQKLPKIQNQKISFAGEVLEILDELK